MEGNSAFKGAGDWNDNSGDNIITFLPLSQSFSVHQFIKEEITPPVSVKICCNINQTSKSPFIRGNCWQ